MPESRITEMRLEDDTRTLDPHRVQSAAPALEAAARAAINVGVGRILSDAEWSRARHNLLAVVRMLRGWEQRAITIKAEDRATEQLDKAA